MPLRRRREVVLRVRDPGWHYLLRLLCSRCGTAVPDVGFQDLFRAKVRQLEQFGLTQEASLSSMMSRLSFFGPGEQDHSP